MAKGKRKRRTHVRQTGDEGKDVPKSFVLSSGTVTRSVKHLVRDFRMVMEPNTASRLRERPTNRLKDFLEVSNFLGVTHFVVFNQTESGTNVRFARVPRGPTLCFKLLSYSLSSDVRKSQLRPKAIGMEHKSAPLLVLNNFGDEENHLKLAFTTIQNMFPAINVGTMKLSEARRVALFNYNSENKTIEFRHYSITVAPVGLSKSIKRIIQTNIPNLSDANDISEYVLKGAAASESDMEDMDDSKIELPQRYIGRGNTKDQQRAVKLVEMGPRMELKLIKVQKDLCGGEVLYHDFIHKTAKEIKEQNAERMRKLREKEARRKEQEANVERKEKEKELHRLKTGKKATSEEPEEANEEGEAEDEAEDDGDLPEESDEKEGDEEEDEAASDDDDDDAGEEQEVEDPFEKDYLYNLTERKDEEDDDAMYYRQEVGEEPDDDFKSNSRNPNRPQFRPEGGRGRGRGRGGKPMRGREASAERGRGRGGSRGGAQRGGGQQRGRGGFASGNKRPRGSDSSRGGNPKKKQRF